jgi:hypothetical protein
MTAQKPNTNSLYSLSTTKLGTVATNPANAAPAPRDTKSAGKAQHTNVPELVNSDNQALHLV